MSLFIILNFQCLVQGTFFTWNLYLINKIRKIGKIQEWYHRSSFTQDSICILSISRKTSSGKLIINSIIYLNQFYFWIIFEINNFIILNFPPKIFVKLHLVSEPMRINPNQSEKRFKFCLLKNAWKLIWLNPIQSETFIRRNLK